MTNTGVDSGCDGQRGCGTLARFHAGCRAGWCLSACREHQHGCATCVPVWSQQVYVEPPYLRALRPAAPGEIYAPLANLAEHPTIRSRAVR